MKCVCVRLSETSSATRANVRFSFLFPPRKSTDHPPLTVTKAGGKITVTTTLIYPDQDDNSQQSSTPPELAGHEIHGLVEPVDTAYSPRLSAGRLKSHEEKTSPKQNEMLVIRFEVSDTGVGIKKSDMAENRLFSPYVQTAAGREQGGKGTGLGLSLVRQIVMLSGGRLGVRSKFGHGTTIYADYPFVLGPQTREGSGDEAPRHFRKNTMGGDTLVDEKGKIDPATPYSDGSATSDYRFVASLRKKSSDPTLDSIDESGQPIGRPRDSSVSTQLSVPAAYRFSSPPTSPGIGSEPPSPSVFVQAPSPPQLHITTEPQSRTIGENSPVSPMVFSHPFLRPENRSHVSSASAPAQVTLTSASPSSASSPVVTPSLAGRPPASTGSKILDFPDGPLRVLVVDDDALTRKLMSRMMERLGCLVTTAENGKLALDKLIAPAPSATSSGDGKETTIEGTSTDDVDVAERGMAGGVMKQPKRVKMEGIDPASGVDAHKHFDITFLDNQVRFSPSFPLPPFCLLLLLISPFYLRPYRRNANSPFLPTDAGHVGRSGRCEAEIARKGRSRCRCYGECSYVSFSSSSSARPRHSCFALHSSFGSGAVPRVGSFVHPYQTARLFPSSSSRLFLSFSY